MTDEPKDLESAVIRIKEERAKRKKTGKIRDTLAPWLADCQTDEKGRFIANLYNALVGLHQDTGLANRFRFDEMRQDALIVLPVPLVPGSQKGADPPHVVTDDDASRTQAWLQHRGLARMGKDTLHQAIDLVAREDRFHPLCDELDALAWDKQERAPTWLATYLGATAQPTEYLNAIGPMFLVSMIARVFWPGCKADYMLVLEGEQGLLKSSACRILFGEQWFGDCLPDIHSKDAKQYLRGKWGVEVAELSAFTKADIETLKAFITRQEEAYRPPWGRRDVHEPRQCVFVGTTNRASYVRDDTGARRFWGVQVGLINLEKLAQDRDQLLAEALHLYRMGHKWWPDPEFEAKWIKPEQETRIENDPWEEPIETAVNELEPPITLAKIVVKLGFESNSRVGTADARRIVSILQGLGWMKVRNNSSRYFIKR